MANFAKSEDLTVATMNISLPDEMKDWVERQTAHGKYANSSDLMRDLVRRAQWREEAIGRLNALIDEGLASGDTKDFDHEKFRKQMREMHLGRKKKVA